MFALRTCTASLALTLGLVACTTGDESAPAGEEGATAEARAEESTGNASEPSTAAEGLLARSIAYHDPNDIWSTFTGTLHLEERRPDGSSRSAELKLDVPEGGMRYATTSEGREVVRTVSAETCGGTVDGMEPSDEEAEALRLTCPQVERSRNYYLYLWGLPMKLRDPGTHIHPDIERTEFEGQVVDAIKVTYDAEVGSDTWYFYFSPSDASLVGYRFYHDESINDGEYITLEGEASVGSMRIPAIRSWYVNADDRFLGEDELTQGAPH